LDGGYFLEIFVDLWLDFWFKQTKAVIKKVRYRKNEITRGIYKTQPAGVNRLYKAAAKTGRIKLLIKIKPAKYKDLDYLRKIKYTSFYDL
jgi:hypothetical protein